MEVWGKILNFGTPSLNLERVKLETSYFRILIDLAMSQLMIKYLKNGVMGSGAEILNFGTPSLNVERVKLETSYFGILIDPGMSQLMNDKIPAKCMHGSLVAKILDLGIFHLMNDEITQTKGCVGVSRIQMESVDTLCHLIRTFPPWTGHSPGPFPPHFRNVGQSPRTIPHFLILPKIGKPS